MLSKCANPPCSSKFRYLNQGRLFLLNSKGKTAASRAELSGHVDQLHYAWLCDQCASTFEVVLDPEDRIKIRARRESSGLGVSVAAFVGFQFLPALNLACDLCEWVA